MAAPAQSLNEPAQRGLARRISWLLLLALLSILLLQLEYSVCPFANLTGHPCPGCGMTRAGLALLHLDMAHAVALHPLSVVCVPIVALVAVDAATRYVLGQSPRWSQWLLRPFTGPGSNWLWAMLAAALLSVWVARFAGAFGGPVDLTPAPGAPLLLR